MKDNTGSLRANKRKEKETHPDRKGHASIDGVEYWISGWVNKGEDGEPWMALKFERKQEQKPAAPSQNTRNYGDAPF